MNNPVLSLQNISFSYGKNPIFHGLTLQTQAGEVIGIIGKNGCGKTTLLKMISGFIRPTDGSLMIGPSAGDVPSVSGVLETPKLPDYLTGDEVLRYYLEKQYDADSAAREFSRWKLEGYADVSVKKYSLGMRQKLGLMVAFLSGAPLLLFDEPTNSLDYESVRIFYECVHEAAGQGKAVLIVTHIIYDLEKNCSRILTFEDGKLQNRDVTVGQTKVFDISFASEAGAQRASVLVSPSEIEKLKRNKMCVNETQRSISDIIRLVSAEDIISVEPVRNSGLKGEADHEI